MQVKEIMSRNIKMIDSDVTLSEAADKMKIFDIGVLPIQENNKIVGLITDRDIVIRAVAKGFDSRRTKVKEIMTTEIVSCNQNESLEEAAKLLEDKQVRRLLVLDDNNNPVGILAVSDLARKSGDEHLAFEVLERVSSPAGQQKYASSR